MYFFTHARKILESHGSVKAAVSASRLIEFYLQSCDVYVLSSLNLPLTSVAISHHHQLVARWYAPWHVLKWADLTLTALVGWEKNKTSRVVFFSGYAGFIFSKLFTTLLPLVIKLDENILSRGDVKQLSNPQIPVCLSPFRNSLIHAYMYRMDLDCLKRDLDTEPCLTSSKTV